MFPEVLSWDLPEGSGVRVELPQRDTETPSFFYGTLRVARPVMEKDRLPIALGSAEQLLNFGTANFARRMEFALSCDSTTAKIESAVWAFWSSLSLHPACL